MIDAASWAARARRGVRQTLKPISYAGCSMRVVDCFDRKVNLFADRPSNTIDCFASLWQWTSIKARRSAQV
jgi:hypothetical protein